MNHRFRTYPGGLNLLSEIVSNLKKIAKISLLNESGNSEVTKLYFGENRIESL